MKKGKHRTYAEKERDGEIKRLKDSNRRLKSENDRLKSELKTYRVAFEKNIQFLKGKTKDLTVEELIEGAKKEQSLKEIETQKELTFKELEKKWKCFKCSTGVMRIISYMRPDGAWYIRKCSNSQCTNRTKAQPWNDKVEGVK